VSASTGLAILVIAGGLLALRGRSAFAGSTRRSQRRVERAEMEAWVNYIIEDSRLVAGPGAAGPR
jgi:hypothetical protein